MKNFYELLDINADIDVTVRIKPIVDNGVPWCYIKVNDKILWDAPSTDLLCVTHQQALLDPMKLCIGMSGKIYDQNLETAIIIDSIDIDGFQIVPGYLHLSQYTNDHDQNIVTNYIGYNGVWSINIDEPFYVWRHRVTGQGWLLRPTA